MVARFGTLQIYRRTIWQCNHKFANGSKCQTLHIYEDNLKKAFIEVFNSLLINKEETLKNYEAIIKAVTNTSKLDREKAEILKESEDIFNKILDYVEANSYTTINQEEYNNNYSIMEDQYKKIKCKLEEINNKYAQRIARQVSIREFISTLNKNEQLLTEFNEELWNTVLVKRLQRPNCPQTSKNLKQF